MQSVIGVGKPCIPAAAWFETQLQECTVTKKRRESQFRIERAYSIVG
jgi:hypothetical protein